MNRTLTFVCLALLVDAKTLKTRFNEIYQ